MKRILITGGCGFIGSNFIRHMLNEYSYEIVNIDALTYAGNPNNLKDIKSISLYHFIHGRVEDINTVREAMKGADTVVHFAAESHVDRSILNALPFALTNIIGTQTLLGVAKEAKIERFVHISTDEVYGELNKKGKFKEENPLNPNSPYAACKASADLLVKAYYRTFSLPVIIVRPSNNYGPYQYPEKFIPLLITNLLEDKPVPIYGAGTNIRDWLYVEDCCNSIDLILHKGRIGEIYNVGGQSEYKNLDIAKKLIALLGKDKAYIKFIPDRPGHDFRYALDVSKIKGELRWQPSSYFEDGLNKTIKWYRENKCWWRPLKRKLKKESKGFWS